MLFGRITYQLMESYWSVATTATDDQRIIDAMNDSSKIVFSKTIDKAEWKNSRLVRENMIEEVSELKKRSGKDIVIYGSGSLELLYPYLTVFLIQILLQSYFL